MSLRVKLFSAFIVFIIIPLLILGIVAYQLVSKMIEERYSHQTELTLRALAHSVDFVFGEMNKVTDSTIASRAIQDALSNSLQTGINEIDYLELGEVQRNFRELLVNHPSVSYAFMYTLNNQKVNTLFSKESFTALPFDTFKEHAIYTSVLERNGLPVWVGPFEYPELTGKEPVFTQIRVVKDIETLRDKGILLVQIKNSGIDGIFRYFRYKQEQYETHFMIINEEGLVLYDSGDRLHSSNIREASDSRPWSSISYQSNRIAFDGQDSILSSIPLDNYENWRLVSVTSWVSLAGEMRKYAALIAGLILVCLLLACAFIMLFANRIARSIIQTVRVMSEVERGNLSTRLIVRGNDETSLLARGFNSLVYRVEQLLAEVKLQQERKTEAELMALQAQIKPHFLFNALESINILAIQNQGKKVSQMVARLGNILRISIQQKEEVTIEQELEHLRSYLDIQKFRFEELFDYEIDIPEGMMSFMTLKLTLQPLVENSIQHGFEGIDYMGQIRIYAEEEEDRIIYFIEDNGIGMSTDQLAKFKYMLETQSMLMNHPQTGERRGLGVSNVADRIRIRYGPAYGLLVSSQLGSGTKIRLVMPKYTESDHHEIKRTAN
jgi:two-component system sensor histidine kinase YesM